MVSLISNLASLRAQRSLSDHTREVEKVGGRLSSGLRINTASDDAAGLAIATQLNANSRVANRARLNISDGISALETALSATDSLTSIVTRIGELAEQAANGSYSRTQREAINREAQALRREYIRIQESTEFSGINLLDGSSTDLTLQIGIRGDNNSNLAVGFQSNLGGDFTTDRSGYFDGVNDSLEVEGNLDRFWRGGAFTIEATINLSSSEVDAGHIVSQAYNGTGEYNYRFGYNADGTLFLESNGDDGFGVITGQSFNSNRAIARDTWQHVAVSIGDDRSVRLFINGENVGGGSLSPGFTPRAMIAAEGPVGTAIGTVYPTGEGGAYPTASNFQGQIDQVRVTKEQRYPTSFDPSSIMQVVDDKTVLLITFNASTTSGVTDQSKNKSQIYFRNGTTLVDGVNASVRTIAAFNLTLRTDALDALDYTRSLLESLSQVRGVTGASISRLMSAQRTTSDLDITSREAAGRIVNADIASESSAYVNAQIRQQTASALLAQANQQPAIALRLLSL